MKKQSFEKPRIESTVAGIFMLLSLLFLYILENGGLLSGVNSYALVMFIVEAVILCPILVFLIWDKKSFISMMRFKQVKVRIVLLAILLEICITPVLAVINNITLLFTDNVAEQSLGGGLTETPYILMILVMGLFPAVCEEACMRGVFLGAFMRSGRKIAAIVISAACFGLMHGNANQFFYATAMGIVSGIVVEATGSIIPSIVMHFFSNFVSITYLYFEHYTQVANDQVSTMLSELGKSDTAQAVNELSPELAGKMMTTVEITSLIISVILAVVGTLAAIRIIRKMAEISERTEQLRTLKVPEKNASRIINPVLAVAILVWIADIVLIELAKHGIVI
ncbi:MAG: CPBP family intramembrane metalloprotease [Lachnospiraceae bacterium]|nr:CPBP family intramembrane metalloprotease [Lachnospiraceae bacterium]